MNLKKTFTLSTLFFLCFSYVNASHTDDKINNTVSPPDQIIFCVGSPRSGTTVLASLLSGGEDAYPMFPECTFVTALVKLFHDIMYYSDKERFRFYAHDRTTLSNVFKQPVHGLIKNPIKNQPGKKKNLILKDPELTLVMKELNSLVDIPFKVIGIMRDPRDVINSLINVRKKSGQSYDVGQLISYLLPYYRAMEEFEKNNKNFLIVRYEDIVVCDDGTFSRIDKFVGYTISRESFKDVAFDIDNKDPTYSSSYGKGLNQKSVRKYKGNLSSSDIKKISKSFSYYLKKYNYS